MQMWLKKQITEPLEQNINGIRGFARWWVRVARDFHELRWSLNWVWTWRPQPMTYAIRFPAPSVIFHEMYPPTVSKADADADPDQADYRSKSKPFAFRTIWNQAELTVKERLQTIQDVSAVEIWGENRYSMRLWLDPTKMAAYNITSLDKICTRPRNIELPAGKHRRRPDWTLHPYDGSDDYAGGIQQSDFDWRR